MKTSVIAEVHGLGNVSATCGLKFIIKITGKLRGCKKTIMQHVMRSKSLQERLVKADARTTFK